MQNLTFHPHMPSACSDFTGKFGLIIIVNNYLVELYGSVYNVAGILVTKLKTFVFFSDMIENILTMNI